MRKRQSAVKRIKITGSIEKQESILKNGQDPKKERKSDMKKSTAGKIWIMTGAIYVIVFAVLNLAIFLLINERNSVFWTSYIFICLAFLVRAVSVMLAYRTLETETVFMGIPLGSLANYYFFAAVFVGVVFMIFQTAPFKLAFLMQILVLAIYSVVAIMALMARNVVQDVSDNVRGSVQSIQTLKADVDIYIPQVTDPELKKALQKLSETIRYSDPMSNAAVADIEGQIMQNMNDLRVRIENNQNQEAVQICRDIEVLFLQRNSLLKATK